MKKVVPPLKKSVGSAGATQGELRSLAGTNAPGLAPFWFAQFGFVAGADAGGAGLCGAGVGDDAGGVAEAGAAGTDVGPCGPVVIALSGFSR